MPELKTSNKKITDLHVLIENVKSKIEKTFSNYRPLFNGERYLTDHQLSEKLNISKRTLQRYRSTGELPFQTVYQKTYYKESDVHTFIRENFNKKRNGRKPPEKP